jgi:hypothetical protein
MRADLQSHVEIRYGILIPLKPHQGYPLSLPGKGGNGIELNGLVEAVNRLLILSKVDESYTFASPCDRVLWLLANSLLKKLQSLFVVATL